MTNKCSNSKARKLLLLAFALSACQLLWSQEPDYTRIFVKRSPANLSSANGFEAEGSPYLNIEFEEGEFKVKNTSYIAPVRYNIFLDIFETIQGTDTLCINKVIAQEVKCSSKKFIYYEINGLHRGFQLLASGKNGTTLLKKYKQTFEEARFNKKGKQTSFPKYLDEKPEYYFRLADGTFAPITQSPDFKTIVPARSKEIAAFIKAQKLKKKSEENWVKIFNYIASL